MKKICLSILLMCLLLTSACGISDKSGEDIKLGDTLSNEYMQITLNEVGIYDNLTFISDDLKDTDDEKYVLISYTYKNLDQAVETHSNWVEIKLYNNKDEYSYIKHYSIDDLNNFYCDEFIDVEPLEEKNIFSVIKVPNAVVETTNDTTLNIKVGTVNHKYVGSIELKQD